jgi:hypothetical protein
VGGCCRLESAVCGVSLRVPLRQQSPGIIIYVALVVLLLALFARVCGVARCLWGAQCC